MKADDKARRFPLGLRELAWAVALASLLLPLAWSAMWTPQELQASELSRRIGVALHGAEALSVEGAENAVPALSELGRGQLPFSLIALSFQVFGLNDWAGRLPLALWSLIGVGAVYYLVARLGQRVAAAYSVLVLATMPLYFLHARTMAGDGVTLGAVALASAGLALLAFGESVSTRARKLGLVGLAVLGLAAAFCTRGLLFGIACPMLATGIAWAIWRASGEPSLGLFRDAVGVLCLAAGGAAALGGAYVLVYGSPGDYLLWLGAAREIPSKLPTHDSALHQLGFSLFPWSAVLPFLLATALWPRDSRSPLERALRVYLFSAVAIAMAVHGLSSAYVRPLPFVGTFALAALAGLAFMDLELEGMTTRVIALGAAALIVVIGSDLIRESERAVSPFMGAGVTFPESFTESSRRWWTYGSALCVALTCFAWAESAAETTGAGEDAAGGRLSLLSRFKQGLEASLRPWRRARVILLASVIAVLAALSGLMFASERGIANLGFRLAKPWSTLAQYGVLVLPMSLLAIAFVALLIDVSRWLFRRLPVSRVRFGLLAITAFGFALSTGYYPALANEVSPKDVFSSYQRLARGAEPLAILGNSSKVARYYGTQRYEKPRTSDEALEWLLSDDERRWLVIDATELATLSSAYRLRHPSGQHLPILDVTSSEVFLASNRLEPGQVNQNPLAAWVSKTPPATPQHPLDVDLEGKLLCLGWAVTDSEGVPVDVLSTGRPYDFKIFWQVTAPVTGAWEAFIHLDGTAQRFNGDHPVLGGKYPIRYWQPGDFITDVHRIVLTPDFSSRDLNVHFGLYAGAKRMSVTRGPHRDNSITAGKLRVR